MDYQTLVQKIRNKDESAVRELYNTFYRDVYFICYKIVGNERDAEDVAQETMIKVVEKIDMVTNPNALPSWIKKIANNLSINYIRDHHKFNFVDIGVSNQLK